MTISIAFFSKPFKDCCCILGVVIVFITLTLPRLVQALTPDEMNYFWAAKSWLESGQALHFRGSGVVDSSPYLYVLGEAVFLKVFGVTEWAARLYGVMWGVLAVIAAYLIAGKIGKSRSAAFMAALLIAVTPAFVQGATILDVDCTLLMVLALLLVGAVIIWVEKPGVLTGTILIFATASLLWGRVTTPWILIFATCWWVHFTGLPAYVRRWTWLLLGAGVVLFVLSWGLFCYQAHITPAGPFTYTVTGFIARLPGSLGFSLKSWLGQFGALALWFGPLSFLWVIAGSVRFREYMIDRRVVMVDLLYIPGLFWVVAASIIGVTFGFPKYHLPGALLLTVASGVILKEHSRLYGALLIGLAAGFIVQMYGVGDGLYSFRYELRAFQSGDLIRAGSGLWIWVFAGILIFLFADFRKKVSFSSRIAVVVGLALGMNTALAGLQTAARYDTGYNYGGMGTRAAADLIKERVSKARRIIATDEVIFYTGRSGISVVPNSFWSDLKGLAAVLEDKRTGAFVLSIVCNSVAQVKGIKQNSAVMGILARQYIYNRIGTYDVWIRRGKI